jgi:Immunity protein 10
VPYVTEFTAHAVGIVDATEFGADVLVMAEEQDGTGKRLEVSRATASTEQDRHLGMDTYCLVNENQATVYGGVTNWRCDAAQLFISLSDEANQTLGAVGGYVIRITDPTELALARDAVQRIIDG